MPEAKSKETKVEEVVTVVYPKLVRSSEDAVQAFLEGLIDEKELLEAVEKWGRPSIDNVHRPDLGYDRKLPDFVFTPAEDLDVPFKERAKLAAAKQKEREEAVKAAS